MKKNFVPKMLGFSAVATLISAMVADDGIKYAKKNWKWIAGFSALAAALGGGYAMYEGPWGIQNRPEDTGGIVQKPQNQAVTDKPKKAMYDR